MQNMQEIINEFDIIANGKVVKSVQILWEAYRASMEYDEDFGFRLWKKPGKKSKGKFIAYDTARSNYLTPLNKAADKTNKSWKDVTFEEFCRYGGLKRCRKGKLQKQVWKLQNESRDISNHLSMASGILEKVCAEIEEKVSCGYRSLNGRKLSKGVATIKQLFENTKNFMKKNDIKAAEYNIDIF